MDTNTVFVQSGEAQMPLYVARPDGQLHGAVVVVQEAFGVNDHIEDVTRRFAAAGYLAVAPHLFHRSGGGSISYDDFSKVMPHFAELNDDLLLADLDAALGYVQHEGIRPTKTAVVGFCFGGRVAFLAAANRALGAAVTFYGGAIVTSQAANRPPLIGQAASLRTPWLGIFGDKDESIPVADVQALEAEAAKADVSTQVVQYPEGGHGFHCDARASYDENSAKDAWSRTLGWLEAHAATSS